MSFRPRNYLEALDYLNRRKYKHEVTRTISTHQEFVPTDAWTSDGRRAYSAKGQPVHIRDSLVAHTNDPLSTYGDNPPPISFRQWNTNIATFYPDGSVAIDPHDSVTTRERMSDMGLPGCRSPAAMGMTKNQAARLCTSPYARQEMKGFRYGVPPTTHRAYLLDADKNFHHLNDEPTEDIYVEATPGVHKAYQLGRKRLLKVLKQYADMVEATTGHKSVLRLSTERAEDLFVTTALECPSLGRIRGRWMQEQLLRYNPETVADLYINAKEQFGLYDLTHRRDLWKRKTVNSRDLDQWL